MVASANKVELFMRCKNPYDKFAYTVDFYKKKIISLHLFKKKRGRAQYFLFI